MTEKIHTMPDAVIGSIENQRLTEENYQKRTICLKRFTIFGVILSLILIIMFILSVTVFNSSDVESDSLPDLSDTNSTVDGNFTSPSAIFSNPSDLPQVDPQTPFPLPSVSGTPTPTLTPTPTSSATSSATVSCTPTLTTSPTTSITVTPVVVRASSGDKKKFGDNILQIIGVAVIVFIIVMVLIGLWCHCKENKKRTQIRAVPRRIIYEVEQDL